jgi:multicomponent Na+:H+ antiporter subunit C
METLLAFVIGGLYAAGVYMLLRRNLVKLIIGLALIGQASNLLIFTSAGLTRAHPPLVDQYHQRLMEPHADPLPQALILTAIVIGFAILAFALVLFRCAYQSIGEDDLDQMRSTDL